MDHQIRQPTQQISHRQILLTHPLIRNVTGRPVELNNDIPASILRQVAARADESKTCLPIV
ncbi:hypothetical protein CZ674_10450 [Agrococcus casei LMG 22410]|uniref:Uncharacterized protein n=1 Tax=Agrococcus casei LMG 22410 TaxID=1255656 RepID=A0A1R4GB25_9MICO|nr:hypothetical protein CZ674_10450 [Agrococcus casei LMG 22410]